ncbi:hypothetical protein [Glycomyces paridis]|uniref:Uncharacterized protein n=1 Tax=Glycomyces paridis TaxID=2126555 RepID=A0A4V4HPD5_9ACTN|nr:hypothetical protein [Glycomyces paridis]THV29556.1 hypothetical protein E9998_08640 [Glycomyces paridis]
MPRLKIAVRALAWTMRTMTPPVADQSVVEFVADALAYLEQQVQQGNANPDFPSDLDARHDALLDEEIAEAGVDPILNAVTGCFAYGESELRTQAVYDTLSSCYEAQFQRIAPDMAGLEFERDSARCLEVIDFQKTLIDHGGDTE